MKNNIYEIAKECKCDDWEECYNEMDEDEIIDLIKDVDKCLFNGGYFDKKNTSYILHSDYIEVYVDDEFDGNYYMIYDRGLNVNRLYTYGEY